MYVTGGAFKGRRIKTLGDNSPDGYRPATAKARQAIFSMLDARGVDWERTAALDLFAGSGALGFEALSRGAAFVCFVEKSAAAIKLIKETATAFGLPASRGLILHKEVLPALSRGPKQFPQSARRGFGLVCIDPPYGHNMLAPTLAAVLDKDWAADEGFILAEIETRPLKGAPFDPACDPRLETLVDRAYGQTRIILWKTTLNPTQPSIPAPSTP
jgi:16S rRNA (guanine966-N2)-methyltransferase